MNKRMMDIVDDLWTIFECPVCGILFWSEEKIEKHIKDNHPEKIGEEYFTMEFIRAIPQHSGEEINPYFNKSNPK